MQWEMLVTAEVGPLALGATSRLAIALKDLSLAQFAMDSSLHVYAVS